MFEKVIGHNNIKKELEKDISLNKVSHAYVFYGKEGIGKNTLAEEFAKQLLNVNILATCPDYKYITTIENKSEVIIEQVRNEIITDVNIAPATSRHKVYVIDGMPNDSAQNALLKTLEEPPEYVVIILIVQNLNMFLPTVISRTKNISFDSLSKKEIEEIIGEEISEEVILSANGSISKIKEILNKENIDNEEIDSLVESIKNKDEIAVSLKLSKMSLKTMNLEYLKLMLLNNKLYYAVTYIEDAENKLKRNCNEDIVKMLLGLRLCK